MAQIDAQTFINATHFLCMCVCAASDLFQLPRAISRSMQLCHLNCICINNAQRTLRKKEAEHIFHWYGSVCCGVMWEIQPLMTVS